MAAPGIADILKAGAIGIATVAAMTVDMVTAVVVDEVSA